MAGYSAQGAQAHLRLVATDPTSAAPRRRGTRRRRPELTVIPGALADGTRTSTRRRPPARDLRPQETRARGSQPTRGRALRAIRPVTVAFAAFTLLLTTLWIVGPAWWTSAVAGNLAPVHLALIAYVVVLLGLAFGYIRRTEREVLPTPIVEADDEQERRLALNSCF